MSKYMARFSYSIKPVDRERALSLLGQEVEAARGQGLEARLLVPLTRPPGGPARRSSRSATPSEPGTWPRLGTAARAGT